VDSRPTLGTYFLLPPVSLDKCRGVSVNEDVIDPFQVMYISLFKNVPAFRCNVVSTTNSVMK
jgi:hypothetical protein